MGQAGAQSPDSTASWSADSEPGNVPDLGTAMGRYRLETVIGAGGMAVVFAARDPDLARRVAVKVMRPRADGDEAMRRLRREAQTMAQLVHANVVRIYDVGVAHGYVFIAMEYVEGGTLDAWLRRAPRDVDEIMRVFMLAGRGLAAAHEAGLVHRDFKPSNVLVGDDGRVLVTDFGLARSSGSPDNIAVDDAAPMFPEITRTGAVAGTPAFMPPEQWRGGTLDARADQFSFCVALWRALYGAWPYAGSTLRDLVESTARGVIAKPAGDVSRRVSPRVRAALERGLHPLPSDRFASMNELLHALEPRQRRRWWLAIAGGLVIVAVALLWLTRPRAPTPPHRYHMQRITFGGDVTNAAMSPDGRYVAFSAGDKLERVDVDNGSVSVLATDADAFGVVSWSQDGRRIGYARPHTAGNDSVVIDADGRGVRSTFGAWNVLLGARDEVLRWRIAQHRFFVGTAAGSAWTPCDLPGDFVWLVRVVASGDDVFVGVMGDEVTFRSVLRTDARCSSATAIGDGLELTSLGPAPDGIVALARAGAEHELVALDRDGHVERLGATARGSLAHVVGARPDGSVVLIDGEDSWRLLCVSPRDGVREIMAGSQGAQFDIGPDGARVALVDRAAARPGDAGTLRVVPLADPHTRPPPIETAATATAWSPDGARLATLVRTSDGAAIVVEDADGSARTVRKVAGTSFEPSIVWVDADTVAYRTADKRTYRAIALHDGSERDLFDRTVGFVAAAQREPHGNRFLVWWDPPAHDRIATWIVDPRGVAHEVPAVGPSRAWWSADGRSLLVEASRHAIDIVDLATGVRRPYATLPDDHNTSITNVVQLPGGDLLVATARSVYDVVLLRPTLE